jgi:hypothetical protein
LSLTVTHTAVATAADDPEAEINKDEWNAAHTLAGDYLRKVTVPVSSAQLLDLHNTPVTLVAAPGAGSMLLIHRVLAIIHGGTVTYTTTEGVPRAQFTDGDASNELSCVLAADGLGSIVAPEPSLMQSKDDVAFVLDINDGNLADGDRSLTVTVWYSVEDVP